MTIDERNFDEKLQYNIDREVAISALSSGKIDKYEYLTGEKILPSDQSRHSLTSQVYLFSFRKSFCETNKND